MNTLETKTKEKITLGGQENTICLTKVGGH